MLWLGGAVVALAATLGGATGFGFALLSAPLLLALGFPLRFVVTANLALALLTRVSVAYRFRAALRPGQVALLTLGSLPGLLLGSQLLAVVRPSIIKLVAGGLVLVATALLSRAAGRPPPRPIRGASLLAGLLGGLLGATTSLNGLPAVLLLARDRAAPRRFLADLAAYFVCSNTIALGLLAARGTLMREALFPAAALWLPGALLGNLVGVILSTRLPEAAFRRLTFAVAFGAGAVTMLTAR